MMNLALLVEETLATAAEQVDLALNYAETEVGVNNFARNWPRVRGDALPKIRRWLRELNADVNHAEAIINTLDDLAKSKRWLTPFTAKIPLGK